ncbi:serine hydrolase domain-containing protein [Allosphingosinicella vermicomposti]|uniref:serine hydrolase domain-containing protein n=1 Tax=Allosphingosinicella vermicomposti TaxID=614671 RepID=UPI00131A5B6D|nr:serine hydrolase domain-containing protein [Allosphingosinicella vermicomposti]
MASILLVILVIAAASVGSGSEPEPDQARTAGSAPSGLKAALAKIVDAKPRPNKVDYARLDRLLTELSSRKPVVGLAVAVVEDGEIRFMKGYGETVSGSGDPITTGTVFRWASVSKGVAGDMVAKLAADGQLSLYDPASKYAPSLRLPAGAEHKATVSDILSHQLGLFAHANDSKLEDGMDARLLRSELATLSLICPPGQCHAYQNVAYDAASEVVEKITGQPYPEAVREHLFEPLGMTTASATREGLYAARSWAKPHQGGKGSKPVEVTDSYYRVPAAGGINGSIKDLALWMIAQMGEMPDVLPKKALEAAHTPLTKTPGELGRLRIARERLNSAEYGLGWRIYDYSGHRVVGHRGGVTGYRSLILFDPQQKSGVVALWNSATSQPAGVEFEVLDMLYGLEPKDWLKLENNI